MRHMSFALTNDPGEVVREGFVPMSAEAFVDRFCRNTGCKPSTVVTRIEFEHVESAS